MATVGFFFISTLHEAQRRLRDQTKHNKKAPDLSAGLRIRRCGSTYARAMTEAPKGFFVFVVAFVLGHMGAEIMGGSGPRQWG
jgi:hypothetical protein